MGDDPPLWDEGFASHLDGAMMLVGITYNEPSGPRVEQFFGTVIETDEAAGITLRLEGSRSGEIFYLPPDQRGIFPASPGSYRLRETGEIVIDPDYTATWEVTPPRP